MLLQMRNNTPLCSVCLHSSLFLPASLPTHASVAAIRLLRGANAKLYGIEKEMFRGDKPTQIGVHGWKADDACTGKMGGTRPNFSEAEARALLDGLNRNADMPNCPVCLGLVVGALAIRTATNLEDVKDLL